MYNTYLKCKTLAFVLDLVIDKKVAKTATTFLTTYNREIYW